MTGVSSPDPTRPTQPDTVRLAMPAEAGAIAAIQRRSWEQRFPPDVAREVLRSIDLAEMTASWHAAIVRPPLAQFRVLVGLNDGRPVAFAAIGPSDDPDAPARSDALVAEFVVHPRAPRQGHGSRLLNAVADTLRTDGFTRATWWVRATDDVTRGFLADAGWATDGSHQTVGTEDAATQVKLVRLHTALA